MLFQTRSLLLLGHDSLALQKAKRFLDPPTRPWLTTEALLNFRDTKDDTLSAMIYKPDYGLIQQSFSRNSSVISPRLDLEVKVRFGLKVEEGTSCEAGCWRLQQSGLRYSTAL